MRRIDALSLSTAVAFLSVTLMMCSVRVPQPAALSPQDGPDLEADVATIVSAGPAAYGTNVWWTDQDAEIWTSRWSELRPSIVRLFVSHALVEPENDNLDPTIIDEGGFLFETPITVTLTRTATYRDWFEALRDQPNLDIMIHFSYLAPWLTDNPPHEEYGFQVAPYPPNDLDEYREFVEATLRFLVEEIDFPAERITIEAMNEPDLGCGVDPVVPCFWQDWTMTDITEVVRMTHETIQAVEPAITLIGLAECCGTSVVEDLLDNTEGDYLEGLSYHYYAQGYNLNQALSRASTLAAYDYPLYLDEYGSRQHLSEGVDGALWHSWALATLWEAEIAPIQYPSSEWPLLGEPYNSMGLFADWRGGWERKPAYWVHANFFRFATGDVVSHTAPTGLDVLVTRQIVADDARVTFWVVNRGDAPLADQTFAVQNFPTQEATLRAYDNLVGTTPLTTTTAEGSPLVFTATLPARSSRAFVLQEKSAEATLDRVDLTPISATRTAGQAITYTLTAYDTAGASWNVTASGTYTIEPGTGGRWQGNTYTTEVAGTWTVTGVYSDETDTAVLRVKRGLLERVSIAPTETERFTGRPVTYTLTAYDAYANQWDVTHSAVYTIEPGAGGEWNGNTYTTAISGTWTVTGTWVETGTAIYYDRSDTATLVVQTPAVQVYLPIIIREL